MKVLYCTFLLFAAVVSSSASFVFDLDVNTFDHYLKEKDVMLVDFFAPWCMHCKNLAPELENAANSLATKNQFVFAKVDCIAPQNEALCKKFNVQGYPSLKLFKFGEYSGDYIGGRTTDDLLNYMESVTETSAQKAPLTANGPASFAAALGASPQSYVNPIYQPHPQPFQVPQPGQVTPYFNSPLGAPAPAPAPSLINSFYNTNQPSNHPAIAAFAPAKVQATAPNVHVGPTPDTAAAKFGGNVLALEILRAKLKMIAAYKNWQKRLKEYKEKLTDAAKMNPYNQNKGFTKHVIHKPAPAAILTAKAFLRKSKASRFQKKYPRTYRTPVYRTKPAYRPYRPAAYRRGSMYGRRRLGYLQQRAAYQRTLALRQQLNSAYKRYLAFKQQQRQRFVQQQRRQQIKQQQQQKYERAYSRSFIARPPEQTNQPQQEIQDGSDDALQQEDGQANNITEVQTNPQDEAQPQTQVTTGQSQGQVTNDGPKEENTKTSSSEVDVDTQSIKDLKEDIESAIKDALKSTSGNNKAEKVKALPTVGSKTLDVSESGSGNDQSSSGSGENHSNTTHIADMNGSGSRSKTVGSGSGSGSGSGDNADTSKKSNDKASGEA